MTLALRPMGRNVAFDCGHSAWRIARDGRSLVGERLRCHECGLGSYDSLVVSESAPQERPA